MKPGLYMLVVMLSLAAACSREDSMQDCLGRSVSVADLDNSIVLNWNAPLTRTDGSPIGELSGYKVYYGVEPDDLRCVIEIGDPKAVAWTVPDLSPGTWHFAVVSVDSGKVESKLSAVVSKKID
jgi:hypothetical protein